MLASCAISKALLPPSLPAMGATHQSYLTRRSSSLSPPAGSFGSLDTSLASAACRAAAAGPVWLSWAHLFASGPFARRTMSPTSRLAVEAGMRNGSGRKVCQIRLYPPNKLKEKLDRESSLWRVGCSRVLAAGCYVFWKAVLPMDVVCSTVGRFEYLGTYGMQFGEYRVALARQIEDGRAWGERDCRYRCHVARTSAARLPVTCLYENTKNT